MKQWKWLIGVEYVRLRPYIIKIIIYCLEKATDITEIKYKSFYYKMKASLIKWSTVTKKET